MPNLLKMAKVQSILSLHAQGRSRREIARTLNVDRGTVRKYLLAELSASKPANAPPGSLPSKPAAPGGEAESANAPVTSKPAIAPVGPRSQSALYHDAILAKSAEWLGAIRIHQDLVAEGASISYDSVRRYLRRLGCVRPLPFRRMECDPGEEAQVDFGTGAPVIGKDGKRRRTHVLRVVLSHSRKGYSEVTFRQTTDDFLGALENAFRAFGGAPKTLVIDNLKAAVLHPDWFDPEITPKVQAFCRYYGVVVLPTKPRMPRHKGKVEAGVKYVQRNALKAKKFETLAAQNEHLAHWEKTIADTRIHGTTKQQVGKLFYEAERDQLLPLPLERFANFQEARRKVNRDGHIEVAKAYYSAPPEYFGRTVWARWDARLVRIFNQRFEQVAMHVRQQPGYFSTLGEHLAAEKINSLERGASYLLGRVRSIGDHSHEWAQAMLHARGVAGVRVLQGLLALTKKHSCEALENACRKALLHGVFHLRTLRKLVDRQVPRQQPLPFLEAHPIIRPLEDYAAVLTRALQRQEARQEDRSSLSEGFLRHGSGVRGGSEKSLDRANDQGLATCSTRPRSGYPSPGCTSAEPDSVSPDVFTVVPFAIDSSSQEKT